MISQLNEAHVQREGRPGVDISEFTNNDYSLDEDLQVRPPDSQSQPYSLLNDNENSNAPDIPMIPGSRPRRNRPANEQRNNQADGLALTDTELE